MNLVECVSERKSMPGQLKVGEKYWIDYSSSYKDSDGDEYATVYLDEAKQCRVGVMLTSHFKII